MKLHRLQLIALFLACQCHEVMRQGARLNLVRLVCFLSQLLALKQLVSAHKHLCDDDVHQFQVLTLAPQAGSNQLNQFQLRQLCQFLVMSSLKS